MPYLAYVCFQILTELNEIVVSMFGSDYILLPLPGGHNTPSYEFTRPGFESRSGQSATNLTRCSSFPFELVENGEVIYGNADII